MRPITLSKHVNAQPEKVYAAVTDIPGWPSRIGRIERVEMLTDGPVRVGTRFRETRKMMGRECSETMEVMGLEPSRSVVLGAESNGCRYRVEKRFVPENGGTRIDMTFEATPLTFGAKVLSVVFAPMAKMMTKECARDLDDLAAAIEGQA